MKIELQINNSRPWQINTPPPRDRLFEIMHQGTRLICGYDERRECWGIGTDTRLEREDITHWRELSTEQHAYIWDTLIANPFNSNFDQK
jgi:predicted Fe-S protein YdhL (DUF1289 family)